MYGSEQKNSLAVVSINLLSPGSRPDGLKACSSRWKISRAYPVYAICINADKADAAPSMNILLAVSGRALTLTNP